MEVNIFFFKQKTAYEMRISDWSSDVCSSDLVRIVDVESGRDCGVDERGEIVVRGPNMLKGYYNAPDKTAEVIRNGWFHTGDLGSIDAAGQLMFHGRAKDMLKVGGETLAAADIAALLPTHPAGTLPQGVGCPPDRHVEVPAPCVELAAG